MTESSFRRVPVYILADTSGSMTGAPIEAVNNHLKVLKDVLMSNPVSIETAFVSLITFGGENARVVCPLTEIVDFEPPILEASGLTPLGDAMKKLNEAIDKEVRIRDENYKGDYKPLVYVLTDGGPNDDGWREAIEAVKKRINRKVTITITLGCGPEVDEEVIKFISSGKDDIAIKAEEMNSEIISKFFEKMSQSIASVGERGEFEKRIYEEELGDVKIL